MSKIYLLLRNNQQTGPHDLEELLGLGIKPMDLIWVEGKSAGWRYPSEIDALQSYIEEPAQIKQLSPAKEKATEKPSQLPDASKLHPQRTTQLKAPPKKIFISLPAGIQITPTPIETSSEKEQSFAERAEKMRQKAMGFVEGTTVQEEKPEVDTRYLRSLDEIKQEYTDWMQQQKRKKPLASKKLLPAGIALFALIVVGVMAIKMLSSNGDSTAAALPNNNPVVAQSVDDNEAQKNISLPAKKLQYKTVSSGNVKTKMGKTESKKKVSSIKKMDQPEGNKNGETATMPAGKTETAIVSSTEVELPAKTTVNNKWAEKATVPLSQLIDIKANYIPAEGKAVGGLKISIRNNSSEVLKLVAVDVLYYKNEKLVDKKILYFNNLTPGDLLIQEAPGNKKAASASYRLGLVSTQQSGLYVVR